MSSWQTDRNTDERIDRNGQWEEGENDWIRNSREWENFFFLRKVINAIEMIRDDFFRPFWVKFFEKKKNHFS